MYRIFLIKSKWLIVGWIMVLFTNMDSADAAGDIAFGLSQLLLPFICFNPMMEHSFVWCQNRKWLTNSSDSTRQMVYRRFD